jgi:hypothetical protein
MRAAAFAAWPSAGIGDSAEGEDAEKGRAMTEADIGQTDGLKSTAEAGVLTEVYFQHNTAPGQYSRKNNLSLGITIFCR